MNKDFKDQVLIDVAAWHQVGKVLCFVWKEKHFISTQHEKKKFALGHKEAIVFLISLGRKATKARKKAFLSATKAIVLLLISLGDKSDKGEKKNCLFIRTWSFVSSNSILIWYNNW